MRMKDIAQLVHRQVGGVDDQIGQRPDPGHLPAFLVDTFPDRSIRRERMGPAGLTEAAHQRRAVRLEKDQARLDAGHRLQFAVDLGELLEEPAFAHIDDNRDPLETGIAADGQLAKVGMS
jgi:hypothetical protein